MTHSEGGGGKVAGRFKRADREAQVERGGVQPNALQIARCCDRGVGKGIAESGDPSIGRRANDQRGRKGPLDVGQPIKAVVEGAIVEKAVAIDASGAVEPKLSKRLIENRAAHLILVRGPASRNKGG